MHRAATSKGAMFHMDRGQLHIISLDDASAITMDLDQVHALVGYLFHVGYITEDTIFPFHLRRSIRKRRRGAMLVYKPALHRS